MRTLFTLAALVLSLAVANAANFPFIRLNGKTNIISDSGTSLTRDGVAIGAGGSSLFSTNADGTIVPSTIATNFQASSIFVNTNDFVYGYTGVRAGGVLPMNSDFDSGKVDYDIKLSGTNTLLYPFAFQVVDDGYTGSDCNGLYSFASLYATNGGQSALYYGNGIYAASSEVGAPVAMNFGESAAYEGINDGSHEYNHGVVGKASAQAAGAKGIGVAGTAYSNSGITTNIVVGGYFEIVNTAGPHPVFEKAALIADNTDTGSPIFVGRNSRTNRVALIASDGAISAGYTNAWKLGAVKSCTGLTMIVTNYIEVIINGTTNAIPLGTITP